MRKPTKQEQIDKLTATVEAQRQVIIGLQREMGGMYNAIDRMQGTSTFALVNQAERREANRKMFDRAWTDFQANKSDLERYLL